MVRIYIIVLCIMMIGCTGLAKTGLELSYADAVIHSGQARINVESGNLSSSDRVILTHAINNYEKHRRIHKKFISNPTSIINRTSLLQSYYSIKKNYIDVSKVVDRNWDSYDALTQLNLQDYQRHALSLDEAVADLVAQESYLNLARELMAYSVTILTIIGNLK